MKLFIIAALVAVAAAGRLEHLEEGRSAYLPPDSNAIIAARSSIESNTGSADSSAFGSSPSSQVSYGGNAGSYGAAGAGQSRYNQPDANEYLPPNSRSASSNPMQFGSSARGVGASNFGSQQQAFDEETGYQYDAPKTRFGSPADSSIAQTRYQPQQYGSANPQIGGATQQYGSASQQLSGAAPQFRGASQQYGSASQPLGGAASFRGPNQQYGSASQQLATAAPEFMGTSQQYGSASQQLSGAAPQYRGANQQFGAANRQYLAPMAKSQEIPHQAFDEETGYIY